MKPAIDFHAVRRNATVVDLMPVSDRAKAFIDERRQTGFTRRGLADMIARGWNIAVKP